MAIQVYLVDRDGDRVERVGPVVNWDDGKLTGDPDMVAALETAARDYDGVRLGMPEGPNGTRHHLKYPYQFMDLCYRVFGESFDMAGLDPVERVEGAH